MEPAVNACGSGSTAWAAGAFGGAAIGAAVGVGAAGWGAAAVESTGVCALEADASGLRDGGGLSLAWAGFGRATWPRTDAAGAGDFRDARADRCARGAVCSAGLPTEAELGSDSVASAAATPA